ncbi:MAG TPA: hypothetical protein VFY46_05145, partial [Acidimicrobiia bacterium]|nr:hypothetical protein [Acidimicrobiia bacterium]
LPALFVLLACSQPATTTASTAGEGAVDVIVTATPVVTDAGVELCPPGMTGKCPGIILDGDLAPEFFEPDGQNPPVITLQGLYNGSRLVPTGEASRLSPYPPFGPTEYASLCPGMRGSGNPDTYAESLTSYTQSVPDAFAGMWWDQGTSVMTLWFVGDDVEGHREAIEAVTGTTDEVCVAGGARFSEAELLDAMDLLAGISEGQSDLATAGYGINTLTNRIDLSVQEIDAALRQEIADTVGERVVLFPYLEMVSGTLSDLPPAIPAVPGNVDILTNRLRYGGGMDALGQFRLGYDSDLNCIYLDGSEIGEGRTVPVWPFGYSAINDPVEVYDYDGELIATQGSMLELGGGFVGAEFVEGDTCGAVSAWIVNS